MVLLPLLLMSLPVSHTYQKKKGIENPVVLQRVGTSAST